MSTADNFVMFKVIVVGEMGVGKTSLMLRYCDKVYTENPIHTVGVSSRQKIVDVDGLMVKVSIWDTAGQERYRTLTSGFYRGATGIIIMYDVTNEDSFNNLSRWLRDIKENSTDDVSKLIVGNKIDLNTKRIITKERAKQFSEFHRIEYFEISCRENTNVEEALSVLARRIKEKIELKSTLTRNKDITLVTPSKPKSSFKCPC